MLLLAGVMVEGGGHAGWALDPCICIEYAWCGRGGGARGAQNGKGAWRERGCGLGQGVGVAGQIKKGIERTEEDGVAHGERG